MYKELIDGLKPELEKTIEFLKKEFMKIKTSRATPAMVEDIMVECYGQRLPVKQLGNISTPQPRLITIDPWDKTILQAIEKAIRSQSSLSPVVDGEVIRINIPPLSEEQRKEYLKIINEKTEEARISIRLHREKAWKEIQELERKGEIREDDKFRAKDDLQELIDDYNKKIEDVRKNKESDIMTV